MTEPTSGGALLAYYGDAIIAAAIGAVGWIVAKATHRHIDSLDQMTHKLSELTRDVGVMRAEIKALSDRATSSDRRIERLEDLRDDA